MRDTTQTDTDVLLTFMAEYGGAYLACGGPTSRLEEQLTQLGAKYDYSANIFATPTGIFIGFVDRKGTNTASVFRIKDSSIDLGQLCWLEGIFDDLNDGKIDVARALKILRSPALKKSPYPYWLMFVAAFLSGFALSYPSFARFPAAILSGAIATLTWWVVGPGIKKKIPSPIFRDFLGCIVTLALAAAAQLWLRGPFEAYAIGGLVVIVPGLALTNAISELADYNLISGTAKLMQAILTLLAMGLAYILFQDLAHNLHLNVTDLSTRKPLSWTISAIGVALSVMCFGILFKVPRRALPWASLTGLLAWVILRKLGHSEFVAAASFFGSLCVGTIALTLGSWFRVPSQVFSVPGIIAMLPGMLALNSFRSLAMGEQTSGLDLAIRVLITAGSIVFGLFTARIPFTILVQKIRFKAASGK